MAVGFPRTDISEKEKYAANGKFFRDCIEYGIITYYNKRKRIAKMNRLMNGYNGFIDQRQYQHLNKTYGSDNISKYVDYRLCRTKIDLLLGEQLELPIHSTVYAINPEAKARKLEDISALISLHYCKDHVDKLRAIGVNVFDGMPGPDVPEGESIFDQAPPKEKNEIVMQYMINDFIKKEDIKTKANKNFFDVAVVAECFSRTYIDHRNRVKHEILDPRNVIYEEADNDPFCKQTPFFGHRQLMFTHSIEDTFDLTDEERSKLHTLANRHDLLDYNVDGRQYYEFINSSLMIEVVYLQFKGWKEIIEKVSVDEGGEERHSIVSNEYYDRNRSKVNSDVRKGRYNINVKYKQTIYECVKIGHDTYVQMREKPNNTIDFQELWRAEFDYSGMLFNSVNGVRISIFQLTEHIDRQYNMCMFQINRELAKAKGKLVIYDEAAAPSKKSTADIFYQMVNDGILLVNSAAEGNKGVRDLQSLAGIKEIDLGVSATIQVLINLKLELQETADRITGILQSRQGVIPATSTATNATNSIQASRMTTSPVFYYFNRYMEDVLMKAVRQYQLVWGYLDDEAGDNIIGGEGMEWVRATKDIAYDQFGLFISDSREEAKIKEVIRNYIPFGINSGDLTFESAVGFEIAQTLAEGKATIKKASADLKKLKQQEQQQQIAAQKEQAQIADDGQTKRVGMQNNHEKEMAAAHGIINMSRDSAKSKQEFMLNEQKSQQDKIKK